MNTGNTRQLQNFGRNLNLCPEGYFEPHNEREVLEILEQQRGKHFRAIGSLHSWSAAPVSEGVILNLRHLCHVEVQADGQAGWVGDRRSRLSDQEPASSVKAEGTDTSFGRINH